MQEIGLIWLPTMNFVRTFLLPVSVLVLQAWLAVILVQKKAIKNFRLFFIYTVFSVVSEIAKRFAQSNPTAYFRVFLITEPIYALLGYLVIAEVFHHVFKNFYRLHWFKFLLPGMGLFMICLSILIATLRPPIQAGQILAVSFVFEIIVKLIQLGVFFLIFGLANFYNLFWRQYSFGIASGFGLAAFGVLVSIIARSIFGTKYALAFAFLWSVTYLLAIVVWLVSFLKPLPPDPLQDVRPMLTPELMRELYERYRKLIRNVFGLCTLPSP